MACAATRANAVLSRAARSASIFPVDGDARRLHSAYELRVGEAVFARSRVDPDDPQTAEVALLVLAADERVLACGVHRFLGRAIQLALGLVKPFARDSSFLRLARRTVPLFTRGISSPSIQR